MCIWPLKHNNSWKIKLKWEIISFSLPWYLFSAVDKCKQSLQKKQKRKPKQKACALKYFLCPKWHWTITCWERANQVKQRYYQGKLIWLPFHITFTLSYAFVVKYAGLLFEGTTSRTLIKFWCTKLFYLTAW